MAKFSISAKLKSRANTDGTHLIQATYTYNRVLKEYGIGYSCDKASWDSVKKLVVPRTSDAVVINNKIQLCQALLFEVASSLSVPSHEAVKAGYLVAAAAAEKKEKEELLKFIGYGTGAIEKMKADSEEELEDVIGLMVAEAGVDEYSKLTAHFKNQVEVLQPKIRKNRIIQRLEETGIYKSKDKESEELEAGKKLFNDSFKAYIAEIVKTKSMKPGSIKQQHALKSKLDKFEAATGFALTFPRMGFDFYEAFYAWCTAVEGNYDNYYGSLIKRLRTFLSWAVDEKGLPVNMQFRSKKFKVTKESHDVIYLKLEELEWLDEFRNHSSCKVHWIRVIDMALVQASIGCRYSDMVNSSWYFEGKLLKGYTIKNVSTYVIPLKSSKWFDILKTYDMSFKLPVRHSDKVEVLSEQKFNKYLKECLQAMYLTKGLHTEKYERIPKKRTQAGEVSFEYKFKYEWIASHSLRRSFVSRMVRMNYKVEEVAKMIGTKSIKELEKYFTMEEEDIVNAGDRNHPVAA